MSRNDPPLRIRLPEALKATVQARAAENRRSMNAEIVRRLEWSLEAEGEASDAQSKASAKRLVNIGTPDARHIDDMKREIEALKNFAARTAAKLGMEGLGDAQKAKRKKA